MKLTRVKKLLVLVSVSLVMALIINIIYFPVSLPTALTFCYLGLILTEHALAWLYAWKIYYWPIKPTWVSVLWGTWLVMFSEMAAIAGTLFIYELWSSFWFMIFIPPAALVLSGVPMAFLQQKKWIEMENHNADIQEVWRD